MRILVTGAAGFVGGTLIRTWFEGGQRHQLHGLDNFSRPGSESNRAALKRYGVKILHADIRNASDFAGLPDVDWVIDAAANPAVLAGTDGRTSARQLVENNFGGTANILEFCRARGAGLILLSTSRVYSVAALSSVRVGVRGSAFVLADGQSGPGISERGITEQYSTTAPRSLYGTSKVASEDLAIEYANAFGVPVWINRCGVLAGAGQFARPDQGIFAYWIHSWSARHPLAYIGFDGAGHQVRDCLHPRDLASLLDRQMASTETTLERILHVAGGIANACSLRQCSEWCQSRFGPHQVSSSAAPRRFDVPWLVLDAGLALRQWGWSPVTTRLEIFEEIASFAEQHPEWLDLSS